MAAEGSRGCGYRQVGGLYLVGSRYWTTCDRLKLEVPVCDCCGETPRPNRGIQVINAFKLFGEHESHECRDQPNCKVCYPMDTQHRSHKDFMIWVGREHYTEEEFSAEAELQGISRRIPHIPDGLAIGRSVIYLAMRNNINRRASTDVSGRMIKKHGIFMAFMPQRLELLIWQSEATDEYVRELTSRGITPVPIPDGDEDHKPKRRAKPLPRAEISVTGTLDIMDGL